MVITNMIKFFIFILLTSCSTTIPVKIPFPNVPIELMDKTDELIMINDNAELSDLIDNANTNYGKYYLLKTKIEAWQYWYTTQKELYGVVK